MINRTARTISNRTRITDENKITIGAGNPSIYTPRPTNPFIGLGAPSMFAAEQTSTPAGNNNALIVVALIAAVIGIS